MAKHTPTLPETKFQYTGYCDKCKAKWGCDSEINLCPKCGKGTIVTVNKHGSKTGSYHIGAGGNRF